MYSCCTRNKLRSPPAPYYEMDNLDPEPCNSYLNEIEGAKYAREYRYQAYLRDERYAAQNQPIVGHHDVQSNYLDSGKLDARAADESATYISYQIYQLEDFNRYEPNENVDTALSAAMFSGRNQTTSAGYNEHLDEIAHNSGHRTRYTIYSSDHKSYYNHNSVNSGDNSVASPQSVVEYEDIDVQIITCQMQRRAFNSRIKYAVRQYSPVLTIKHGGEHGSPQSENYVPIINISMSPKEVKYKNEIKAKQLVTPQPGQTQFHYISEHSITYVEDSQFSFMDGNIEAQISEIQKAIKPHVEFGADYDVAGTSYVYNATNKRQISPQIEQQRTAIDAYLQNLQDLQIRAKAARPKSPFYNQFGFPDQESKKLGEYAKNVAQYQIPAPQVYLYKKAEEKRQERSTAARYESYIYYKPITAQQRAVQKSMESSDAAEFLRNIRKTTVTSRPSTPHSRPRTPKGKPIQEFPPARKQQARPTSRNAVSKTPVLKISLMD